MYCTALGGPALGETTRTFSCGYDYSCDPSGQACDAISGGMIYVFGADNFLTDESMIAEVPTGPIQQAQIEMSGWPIDVRYVDLDYTYHLQILGDGSVRQTMANKAGIISQITGHCIEKSE